MDLKFVNGGFRLTLESMIEVKGYFAFTDI